MAVPSSGRLSMLGIRREIGNNNYSSSTTYANISLEDMSEGINGTINTNNAIADRPNGANPHAMSEFYNYDHDASSGSSLTSFASSGIALSSPANVCNQSTFYTFYHDGNGVLPTTGDTVYTSSSGGSSNYLSSGYYRATHPTDDLFYRIGTNGTVISWGSCIP